MITRLINTGPWIIIDTKLEDNIKFSNCKTVIVEIKEDILEILKKKNFSDNVQNILQSYFKENDN